MTSNLSLDALNDNALLSQFGDLVRQDHEGNAQLLRHIDAIDRRKLWAKRGLRALPNRSTTAPPLAAPAATPAFAAPAPTPAMASAPAPVAPAPAPVAPAPAPVAPAPVAPASAAVELVPPTVQSTVAPPRRAPDPKPLAPGRYMLQVTISESTRDKLKQLQDLLAHQIPNGDPAAILERALDALWVQVHKRKTGISAKPRAAKQQGPEPRAPSAGSEPRAPKQQGPEPRTPSAGSKHAPVPTGRRTRRRPVAVRREVWRRDEGRCGFVGEGGHRCNETRGLEFAHVHPWAKGGADTASNLGLRCAAHNALEADRDYGTGFMATKRQRTPLKVREPVARYVLRGATRATVDRSPGPRPAVGSRGTARSSARS